MFLLNVQLNTTQNRWTIQYCAFLSIYTYVTVVDLPYTWYSSKPMSHLFSYILLYVIILQKKNHMDNIFITFHVTYIHCYASRLSLKYVIFTIFYCKPHSKNRIRQDNELRQYYYCLFPIFINQPWFYCIYNVLCGQMSY